MVILLDEDVLVVTGYVGPDTVAPVPFGTVELVVVVDDCVSPEQSIPGLSSLFRKWKRRGDDLSNVCNFNPRQNGSDHLLITMHTFEFTVSRRGVDRSGIRSPLISLLR